MNTYHPHIQPLVTHLESLGLSTTVPAGYSLTFAPSGQLTTGGSLGVTMTATSATGESHTFEVEDSMAADHYLTLRVDGIVRSSDDARGGDPRIPYGNDIVGFIQRKRCVETFFAALP